MYHDWFVSGQPLSSLVFFDKSRPWCYRSATKYSAFAFFSDEVDIIPCLHCQEEHESEKEGPVIVENHKLGIKSWCVKPLFLFAYNKLMRSRLKGRMDCNLSGIFFLYLFLLFTVKRPKANSADCYSECFIQVTSA